MRHQDRLGTGLGDVPERGHDALDAGGVGHLAVGDRNVEVDAHQHALAREIEIFKGFESGHLCLRTLP